MLSSELTYEYPSELVALEKKENSRILFSGPESFAEVDKEVLFDKFSRGDLLVVNDTKVIKRRVLAQKPKNFEILFCKEVDSHHWEVLCPASRLKKDEVLELPDSINLKIVTLGRTQKAWVSKPLQDDFFEKYGEMPLPPYIQKGRGNHRSNPKDSTWYQTGWAEKPGSVAAPTASLHFSNEDLNTLRARGVSVETLTLHVGIGTFLPITTKTIDEHEMHSEWMTVSSETLEKIYQARDHQRRIWALGTTVTRALETLPSIRPEGNKGISLWTNLFIRPGFEFRFVNALMTNFHQPESTLLALVCAFAGKERVLKSYKWAIERQFRLFSYGDLTVWLK